MPYLKHVIAHSGASQAPFIQPLVFTTKPTVPLIVMRRNCLHLLTLGYPLRIFNVAPEYPHLEMRTLWVELNSQLPHMVMGASQFVTGNAAPVRQA